MSVLGGTTLTKAFAENDVHCYQLKNDSYVNKYYIISSPGTTELMHSPETVGYDVYRAMLEPTARMLAELNEKNQIRAAGILCILRGALNYPLEESCYNVGVPVHSISFLSCERMFENSAVTGLDIRYRKLAAIDKSTLLIGDIIASGDTLMKCMKFVTEHYKKQNMTLKNIVFFTIGAKRGIKLLEEYTKELKNDWPEFEGVTAVYHEGVFNCYAEGDTGVSGVNRANIDFYWKGGIISPEFRLSTLHTPNALFEKCTIYDGGARRYEIKEHIEEVLNFWESIMARADVIDKRKLLEEKLGYSLPVSYEEWLKICHYEDIDKDMAKRIFDAEQKYIADFESTVLKDIAAQRINEFRSRSEKYMNMKETAAV